MATDLLLSGFRAEPASLMTQGSSAYDFRLWPLSGTTLSHLFDHYHSDSLACLTVFRSMVVVEILYQFHHWVYLCF